jgi:hypothetical protein
MVTKVTLKDLIDDLDPEIRRLLYEETRTELNKRPHILDISYKSLLVNKTNDYTDAEFRELHKTLLQVVKEKAKRQFNSIDDPGIKNNFSSKTPYLVYVSAGESVQILMAKSFDAIGTFMTLVSKDSRLVDSIYGQRIKSKKEVLNRAGKFTGDYRVDYERAAQLGHIGTREDVYFTNPLIDKVSGLLDYASLRANSVLEKYVTDSLNDIYNIQANIDYSFKNNTPEALEKFENIFGSMYVVITLQSYDVNQKFSRSESEIFNVLQRKVSQLASKHLQEKFHLTSGSNTALEDMQEALVSILRTGKIKLTKHPKRLQKSPKKQVNKPAKLPVNNGIRVAVPKPTNRVTENVISLTSLQNLINQQLQDVISANMGNGNSRSLLNYRTGRLASSAKVETMSESRAGMITAFYSYMRNPYATFSDGGRQQYPKSRDPKALISRSIREIAAQQVGNRLRAVNI